MDASILLVDDEMDSAQLLCDLLRARGLEVNVVDSARACLEYLRVHRVDVVVTDVRMPEVSGVELCAALRERHPEVLAIVLTGVGDFETAVGAIRAGAYDFLIKPVKAAVLEVALRRAVDHLAVKRDVKRLRAVADERTPIPGIAGTSVAVRTLTSLIRQVADSDATILITGESGTGKELVARACHDLSSRRKEPFVAINCAAMPPSLLESELFGHMRGAFTDAKTSRPGVFVQAGRGTVFLDEIGEMPLEMQVKLLRVLQERSVRPVGGDEEVQFEARVLTATNRDLETEIEERRFREDLYYRINVVAIDVPPLRDRAGDLVDLCGYILGRIAERSGRPRATITANAMRKLMDYGWPGNIRELENYLERAVAVARDSEITVADLPPKVQTYQPQRFELTTGPAETSEMITLDEMERRYVRQVLNSVQGNKTHAARVLGIDRRSLYRRLESPTAPPAKAP